MKYIVDPSSDALVAISAEKTIAAIASAWRDLRRAEIVLTGGRTGYAVAKAIDSALWNLIRENQSFEGSVVHIWFSDERFVPADDSLRNDASLIEAFSLSKSHCIFHVVNGTGDLAESAKLYAQDLDLELAGKPFDIVLLSMGEDGHVASLFPGQINVAELSSAISVTESPKEPPLRVSLSLGRLAKSRSIYVFCLGDSKIEALKAVQRGPVGLLEECSLNAQGGEVNILTDLALN